MRISGGTAEPTYDNYRVYTEAQIDVEFLIYVTSGLASPVICIDIDRSSGPAYISDIKIRDYDENNVPISNPEGFVHLAYNPSRNYQPYTYTLPEQGVMYIDGFGLEEINSFDFILSGGTQPYNSPQAYILFKGPLIAARPYIAVPPLLPADDKANPIAAYPNPANNVITIGGLKADDEWQSANIVNTEGKIVLTKQIAQGVLGMNIQVALLPKGLYFINLKGKSNTSRTIKFIKY